MKKVSVKASWTSDENILKRLLTQFKTSEKDVENIEFVFDDSAELVFFFGYITDELSEVKKYFVLPQEPSWTGGHQKSFPDCKNLTLFGYDRGLYSFNGNFIESVSLMFYGGRGPESEGWDEWTYENMYKKRIKDKKISSCVSSLGRDYSEYPDGSLYSKRVNLINHLINQTDFIDIFSWEENGKNTKGWLTKKIFGVENYKFSLCIENSNEKNYISEKFYDCILNDTIPIYYGCKNIKDFLPENGYILINDLDDVESITRLLTYINYNCDSLYNQMLPDLQKIKNKFFEKYNPLKVINELCK